MNELEKFIKTFVGEVTIIKVDLQKVGKEVESLIRDPKDAPILSAAIGSNIDIIISGDKDFIVLELDKPKTVSPADYLANY